MIHSLTSLCDRTNPYRCFSLLCLIQSAHFICGCDFRHTFCTCIAEVVSRLRGDPPMRVSFWCPSEFTCINFYRYLASRRKSLWKNYNSLVLLLFLWKLYMLSWVKNQILVGRTRTCSHAWSVALESQWWIFIGQSRRMKFHLDSKWWCDLSLGPKLSPKLIRWKWIWYSFSFLLFAFY